MAQHLSGGFRASFWTWKTWAMGPGHWAGPLLKWPSLVLGLWSWFIGHWRWQGRNMTQSAWPLVLVPCWGKVLAQLHSESETVVGRVEGWGFRCPPPPQLPCCTQCTETLHWPVLATTTPCWGIISEDIVCFQVFGMYWNPKTYHYMPNLKWFLCVGRYCGMYLLYVLNT